MAEHRLDIQALRGIAVLLVVAYHAGLPGLSAGYLGVDLFFVLSGFLITGLIKKGLEGGNFSFANFYYRRAKRLLPAAYVVIALVVVCAPFVLAEIELADLRAQVIGSIAFVVNFVLFHQTGYFEGAAEMKPLLHFWSLAVEEQYYFVMPIFLLVTPRKVWVSAVSAIVAVSFCLSVYAAPRYPDFAFYLPLTRIWELGVGSLGALAGHNLIGRRGLSFARLPAIFILLVVPFFPSGLPHPGLDAFLVCISTLVLVLGRDGSPWESARPVKALAYIGDISYSLYLVHWPILVFTRLTWVGDAPIAVTIAAVALSFAAALLLNRLVEEPFRRGFQAVPRHVTGGMTAVALLLVITPSTLSAAKAPELDFKHIRRANYGLDRTCNFGGKHEFTGELPEKCKTKPDAKILVWGDSYAMAWTSALIAPLTDAGLAQVTMSACDPLAGMARFSRENDGPYNRAFAEKCMAFNDNVLRYIANNPSIEIVVIAGRFQSILQSNSLMLIGNGSEQVANEPSIELAASGLSALAMKVRAEGKRVAILAPPPSNGTDIGSCLERHARGLLTFGAQATCEISVESHLEDRGDTLTMLKLASTSADAPVIDVFDFLCDESSCRTVLDGTFLYRDYGHLTYEGARLLGKQAHVGDRILSAAR
ncbi:acyltransferase [Rhizobiaceae bacterium n13]|uniref:Acyltransferase n=1 Tax=Ferirhizobium litorale TaxID=2927786 RepID=A0AAE3U4I1_9HYPH|nr:acyltransferase family protein [Fererhizobium litorale]MDI7863636.1 acyltransferase [Fererhizobium litorale]MDI7923443.1 acyltransferase [Fererhizobium litorale]